MACGLACYGQAAGDLPGPSAGLHSRGQGLWPLGALSTFWVPGVRGLALQSSQAMKATKGSLPPHRQRRGGCLIE